MNIKKELQKKMKDMITITLEERIIKECVDEYLDKVYNLKDTKYKLERAGLDTDLVYVIFEDEDLYEIVDGCYAVEDAILYNLCETRETATVCVFCSEVGSTDFIHVMISRDLLED